MADITSLYQFPVSASSPTWNPKAPVQSWFDPAAQAAVSAMPSLASITKTYTSWSVDPVTSAVTLAPFTTTLGQAAVANVPPAGWTSVPGNATIPSPTNPPIDLAKLPSGYQVESAIGPMGAFGQLPQLVPVQTLPSPVPSGTDPTLTRVLAGVEEILNEDKLPSV